MVLHQTGYGFCRDISPEILPGNQNEQLPGIKPGPSIGNCAMAYHL